MKAPDKIYIQEGAIVRTEKTFDNDVKYIRKDALLEWAKEKYNKAYKLHLKKGDNYAYGLGKMDAYQRLIDKLNSM